MFTLLLFSHSTSGQSFCHTRSDYSDFLESVPREKMKVSSSHHCIRIFIHVIKKSDGTGGLTCDEVQTGIDILNADYEDHDISFIVSGVDEIHNDTYYNYSIGSLVSDNNGDGKFDNFSPNSHSNAIDVYLFPNNNGFNGGIASGIPGTALCIGGNAFGANLATSHVLSHEMGHCLGLFHTFHGMPCEPAACAELVDGSNCSSCGDFVCDTPPDPQTFQVNQSSCTWNGTANCTFGSTTDANGDPYSAPTNMIMSYIPPQCMQILTSGQGTRMDNIIANSALLQATLETSTSLDLYSKDFDCDFGQEPNTAPGLIYLSEDIWVRNQQDGIEVHENPEVDPGQPYVYVRVRNLSCSPTSGNEEVKLHWAKAGTALTWPNSWNGTTIISGLVMGDLIGTQTISSIIPPGGDTVLEFHWTNPPDPSDYAVISNEEWHFCFLSRIITPSDPLNETSNLPGNVVNNNNIVWKNVTVVDNDPNGYNPGGVIMAGNFTDRAETFTLELTAPAGQTPLQDLSEIYLTMDEKLFDTWNESGTARNITLVNEEERIFRVTAIPATLNNLKFSPGEWGTMNVSFNMFTDRYDGQSGLQLNVTQRYAGGDLAGGEGYLLQPDPDTELFQASAGDDQVISQGDVTTLHAADIGRPAKYEWYANGQLIGTGLDIAVSPMETQEYKLRVVAEGDGFTDYDYVTVEVMYAEIHSLVPNPASSSVKITYDAGSARSARITVSMPFSGFYKEYDVDIDQTTRTIDISDYKKGVYTVTLVCDGTEVSSKQLSVE